MEPTPDLNRETPESLANRLSISWLLDYDSTKHEDRMTRLSGNLKNVINNGGVVDGALTSEGEIFLGDKGLSGICSQSRKQFAMFRFRKNRVSNDPVSNENQILIESEVLKLKINSLLKTSFSEQELTRFQEIIFKRCAQIILNKMAEAN